MVVAAVVPECGAASFRGRLPGHFATLDVVIDDTEGVLAATRPTSEAECTRIAVGQRALTLLQAARLLLEEGHWEVATGVARQLFEVLLNVEHVLAQSDPASAWDRYRRYGEAATLQAGLRKLKYAGQLGYADTDGEAEKIEGLLADAAYAEFKTGQGVVRPNWSGKKVAALARDSPREGRGDQYEFYYRTWSEQAHGSSSTLIEMLIPQPESGAHERILAGVARESRHLIVMLLILFADLVSALGLFGDAYGERSKAWREALAKADNDFKARSTT